MKPVLSTFHTNAKLLIMYEDEMQSLRPDVFCLDEYHRMVDRGYELCECTNDG